MSDIKTWNQKCEEHPDHQEGCITEQMVQDRMQEEIDELRAKLEALETEHKKLQCRNLNLLLDLGRLIDGDEPLNGFGEVEALQNMLAAGSANQDLDV